MQHPQKGKRKRTVSESGNDLNISTLENSSDDEDSVPSTNRKSKAEALRKHPRLNTPVSSPKAPKKNGRLLSELEVFQHLFKDLRRNCQQVARNPQTQRKVNDVVKELENLSDTLIHNMYTYVEATKPVHNDLTYHTCSATLMKPPPAPMMPTESASMMTITIPPTPVAAPPPSVPMESPSLLSVKTQLIPLTPQSNTKPPSPPLQVPFSSCSIKVKQERNDLHLLKQTSEIQAPNNEPQAPIIKPFPDTLAEAQMPPSSQNIVQGGTFMPSHSTQPQTGFMDLKPMVKNEIQEEPKSAKKDFQPWSEEKVIAESCDISVECAKYLLELFDKDFTLPFIMRYRKPMTGSLSPEKLREIQAAFEEIKQVRKTVETLIKTVKLNETTVASLLCAKTMDEIELLYSPFKPGGNRIVTDRAKLLALEPLAVQILELNTPLHQIKMEAYINQVNGLKTKEEVLTSIKYIIADKMAKDRRILDFISKRKQYPLIRILTNKYSAVKKEDKRIKEEEKSTQKLNFQFYSNLNVLIGNATAHMIMAINRFEKQNVLTVRIKIPISLRIDIMNFIWTSFFTQKLDAETGKFMKACLTDSYERLIEPYLCCLIRSDLSKKAQKESIDNFSSNLRKLIMTPPVKGKSVIGIDPGFERGCKVVCIDSQGAVKNAEIIHPFKKSSFCVTTAKKKLQDIISSNNVENIAICNGTASKDTEMWISYLIKSGAFIPHHVTYCIFKDNVPISYSALEEAKADSSSSINTVFRGAVAIARWLQDPLIECVKIEPRHLSIGMYQHDVPESQLRTALDSIVEECVSFIGVDLNVCPEILLSKIAGLTASHAKNIVKWRNTHSGFVNREQLLQVEGLGPKAFQQCAGFLRILPETYSSSVSCKRSQSIKGRKVPPIGMNPLDMTIIHPESYDIAEKFLKELKAGPKSVGSQILVNKVRQYMRSSCVENVAKKLSAPVRTVQFIIGALQHQKDYDIRAGFERLLFQTAVQNFNDVRTGQILAGSVNNVTAFGAFVDIGIGVNGLIHVNNMKGKKLNFGDKVTVCVLNINSLKRNIALELKFF